MEGHDEGQTSDSPLTVHHAARRFRSNTCTLFSHTSKVFEP